MQGFFVGTAVKDKAPTVYESDEYKALYQQLLEFAKCGTKYYTALF